VFQGMRTTQRVTGQTGRSETTTPRQGM
jgi:hypothetical protein